MALAQGGTRPLGTYSKNLRSDIGAFLAELRELGAGGEMYTRPVVAAMEKSVTVAYREIVLRTPHASGDTIKSYRMVIRGDPLKPLRGYMGSVESDKPHVAALELGSKPHMPPVAAIAEWVRVRGLAGRAATGARKRGTRITYLTATGRKRTRRINVTPQELRIAWAVAMTIKRRGTKAVHMFREGFKAARPEVLLFWQAALGEIVRRLATSTEGAGP